MKYIVAGTQDDNFILKINKKEIKKDVIQYEFKASNDLNNNYILKNCTTYILTDNLMSGEVKIKLKKSKSTKQITLNYGDLADLYLILKYYFKEDDAINNVKLIETTEVEKL
jgi:hypothetical protein